MSRRPLKTALVIYLVSQILFLIGIQFPTTPNFDEFHYIPSAKQFLHLTENQNWEHPPLAKILIAIGIGIWGDRPIGWRFMSTLFGSLTLVGVYVLGLVLFESEEAALWITLLTFCNNLLYVQARIGMLDTFMFGFLIWAMVAFCATGLSALTLRQNRLLLAFSGLMFGLSISCKWFTIVPWIGCCLLVVLIRLFQVLRRRLGQRGSESPLLTPAPPGSLPDLWKGIPAYEFLFYLGLIPFLVYYSSFIPYLFIKNGHYSLSRFFAVQARMWAGQLRVVSSHPYMSHWTDWPFLKRPIWYAFDKTGPHKEWVRGVLLIGNPWIMWTGMLALLGCFWGWLMKKDWTAFLIVFFYTLFYACWIVIPRKISFYYYYYPAGMMLSFALAYVFFKSGLEKVHPSRIIRWAFLGVACSLFIYFFPILSALKIPAEAFRRWMWFPSWI